MNSRVLWSLMNATTNVSSHPPMPPTSQCASPPSQSIPCQRLRTMLSRIVFLLIYLIIIMTNSYSRPICGGAQPRRRSVFGSRKRGKRRTQVHELSGIYTKKQKLKETHQDKIPQEKRKNSEYILLVHPSDIIHVQ